MNDSVLAQLAALPGKTTPELKQLWRELYDREPPSFNRAFLIKRLAYRIQELAYGGLSARAEAKLDRLIAEEEARLQGQAAEAQRRPADRRHPADPRVAGRRARRHRARRRLRVSGPAVQVAVGDRPRHHRHALERAAVLRAPRHPGARK